MSRPQSSWGDLANLGSNLYQNKQLAHQGQMIEQQNQMMQQQMLLQQLEQVNKNLLIEKRKMLMKIDIFLDKVDKTHSHYPEYSLMMFDLVNDSIAQMELSASDFEDISDMQKANEIQTRLDHTRDLISNNLSQERQSWSQRMKSIVTTEENELERLEYLLTNNEYWAEVRPQYDEILPIHIDNKKSATKRWLVGLILAMILMVGGAVALGDCVEFDSDDVCVTYENENNIVAGAGLGIGFVTFVFTIAYATPKTIAASKSGKIYNPLHEQYEMDLVQSQERNELAQKHGVGSSRDAVALRSNLVEWVNSMSPSSPEFVLEL